MNHKKTKESKKFRKFCKSFDSSFNILPYRKQKNTLISTLIIQLEIVMSLITLEALISAVKFGVIIGVVRILVQIKCMRIKLDKLSNKHKILITSIYAQNYSHSKSLSLSSNTIQYQIETQYRPSLFSLPFNIYTTDEYKQTSQAHTIQTIYKLLHYYIYTSHLISRQSINTENYRQYCSTIVHHYIVINLNISIYTKIK